MEIEMKGISKSFHLNKALHNINFSLGTGDIHALVGENGAGKSTLMKVLSGIYSPDEGEIFVKGKKVAYRHTKDAEKDGIVVIHQELNLLPELTVAENIFLGNEQTVGKTAWLRTKQMNNKAEETLLKLGLKVNPTEKVGNLSIGKQQIIEIAKALLVDARVIIMDEPTASLTDIEISTLFETVYSLQKSGVSFIYISHRMEEIFKICNKITILRDGKHICTDDTKNLNVDKIVKLMVGRELGEFFPYTELSPKEVKLECKNLTKHGEFSNVSLKVRAGEIFGISGLMGAGRSELVETIIGYRKPSRGEILLNGKKVKFSSPSDSIQHGIGFITEDRKSKGLILNASIKDNLCLPNLKLISKYGWIMHKQEDELEHCYIKKLNIRGATTAKNVKFLSGGNQQKVVIGKWLAIKPQVLILDEPTRGVDVGAKKEIYQILIELANQGVAVIMISSDLPEVIGMSTRVGVMFEGKLTKVLKREELTQETIMHYASGGVSSAKS